MLHFTAMPSAEAAIERLCDPDAEVSAHYLICEHGRIVRMVAERDRAWHAGAAAWGAVRDVNSRSIGIELANDGEAPFPEPQMRALEEVLPGILARWAIPPRRVIGHSDCAPGRKSDPGPHFDWRRLARGNLAIQLRDPEEVSGDDAAFVAEMARAGYTATRDPEALLAALRLRHRPFARGERDARDMGMAVALARHFGVDPGESGA